jgi:hypothetical protein
MKVVVFWTVATSSVVKLADVSEELVTLVMEASSNSETSANFYQTTRRKNPEDSHFHTRHRENM